MTTLEKVGMFMVIGMLSLGVYLVIEAVFYMWWKDR